MKGEFVWLLPEAANDNRSSGLQGDLDDGAGGWMPLAVMTGSAASTVIRYLHGDRLGMPVATTDASGANTTPGTYAELQFPGQIKTLPDVYYNRFRDYDPTTGRYVQDDAIGLAGGGNPYLYAGGNPLRWSDALGLSPWSPNPNLLPGGGKVPGGPWIPKPDGKPGQYMGPKPPKGPRPELHWVPDENSGGPPQAEDPYWKITHPDCPNKYYLADGSRETSPMETHGQDNWKKYPEQNKYENPYSDPLNWFRRFRWGIIGLLLIPGPAK